MQHTGSTDDEELRILQAALHAYLGRLRARGGGRPPTGEGALREGAGLLIVVRIVLWNLADSMTTIEELRRYLRDETVDEFAEVEGLRFKAWISDALGERWGAFYLFESREAADQELPGRVQELIGKRPDLVEEFDLEATVEGRYADEELSRLGLAFEARGRASRGRSRPPRSARAGTATRSNGGASPSSSAATASPTAGDCMKPCPEKPQAA